MKRMSPTLNGSSAIRCFKCSDAIKICNRIDFYMRLPHACYVISMQCTYCNKNCNAANTFFEFCEILAP